MLLFEKRNQQASAAQVWLRGGLPSKPGRELASAFCCEDEKQKKGHAEVTWS